MRRLWPRGASAIASACMFPIGGWAEPAPEKGALASIEIGTPAANEEAGAPVVTGHSAPAAEPWAEGNPLWSIPISQLSATRDRPLFTPSRRPPPPIVTAVRPLPAAVPSAPPVPPPFTLVGTIIGEDNRIGIFFNETLKTTTRIRQGEGDLGWVVRSIDPRSAVLEGDGRMVTLLLPEPSEPVGAGAPAPRVSGMIKKRNPPRDNGDGP
jgi:hypothetical protein